MKSRYQSHRHILHAVIFSALLGSAQAHAASSPFPQIPMGLGIAAAQVPPNVVYTIDTSGSMSWNYLPDNPWYYTLNGSTLTANEANGWSGWLLYAPALNGIYFNPTINYTPGDTSDGTPMPNQTPTAAQDEPYLSYTNQQTGKTTFAANNALSTQDLTQVVYCSSQTAEPTPNNPLTGRRNSSCSTTKSSTYQYAIPLYSFYYQMSSGATYNGVTYPTITKSDYQRINILNPSLGGSNSYPGPNATTLTYAQEMQQFANWWSYYSTRILTAKTIISQTFQSLGPSYRVAYDTIYGSNVGTYSPNPKTPCGPSNNSSCISSNTPQTWIDNSTNPPTTTTRDNFYAWLFDLEAGGDTPLPAAVNRVGQYFIDINNVGTWTNSAGTTTPLSCQQNFDLLQTDGYWNVPITNYAGADDTQTTLPAPAPPVTANGSSIYNPINPYMDDFGQDPYSTLANIAFHYWATDLQPKISNNVPANASDPATWQHMVLYGIGLGNPGQLGIDNPSLSQAQILQQIAAGTLSWPNPGSGNTPAAMDDLWHATVNSHGLFFNTKNPTQISNAFAAIIGNIASRTLSVTSVAVTGTQLSTTSIAYVPSYTSGIWTGDVQAYLWNPSTGAFNSTAAWSAQSNITAQGINRVIYTLGSSGAVGFTSTNLSSAQTTALTNPAYVSGATIAQVVANISGDTSQDNILFRNRNGQVLGDIIDASPQYVGAPNLYYTFPGYGQFAAANASRIPVLYTPANDGMLHAIDACAASYPSGVTPPAGCTSGTAQQNAGKELWAYIPNAVLPYLDQRISLSNFSHQYLMDSTPTIGDFCTGGSGTGNSGTCTAWESLLVASEGRGVPGIYALNVTNPTPTASQLSPWEITPSTSGFSAMGYVISQPLLVKTQSMGWVVVFGSGYQNTPTSSGNGYLYFVNPNNGSLLTTLTLPNQVSGSQLSVAGIAAASFNSPGYAQALYVTDNEGDVWKVKLLANASPPQGTQSPSSAPTLGYNGGPMFVATDSSGNRQPISTTPVVSQDTQGRIGVMFGTGQWLFSSDTTDNLTQSLYGVWDVNQTYPGTMTTPITRASLVQQTLSTTTASNTTGGTTYNTRTSTSNPVIYSSAPGGKMGWYIDLPITGERVIVNPLLVFGDVIFTSYVPGATSTDPCTSSNGTSWITAVNYLTGAVPSTNPFGFTGTAASVVSIQVAGQAPQPTVTSSPTGLQLLLPGAGGGTTPQAINFFPPFNGGAATRAWTQR